MYNEFHHINACFQVKRAREDAGMRNMVFPNRVQDTHITKESVTEYILSFSGNILSIKPFYPSTQSFIKISLPAKSLPLKIRITCMKTVTGSIRIYGLFILVLFSGISCKKEPAVNYTNVSVSISLIDYSFGVYAPGSWSTGTKIRIRYAGTTIDSLTVLSGAFNLPQNTPITNACAATMNRLTHTFKIQSNVLNTLEFYDQSGLRISYDMTSSNIYSGTSSDTTTGYLPNTACHLSVFPVR
jgi:hypothetical protein